MIVYSLRDGSVLDVPSPHERARKREVADELRRRIAEGLLSPGDLLPSEAAIAAEFTIARGTAREAVQLLVEWGLVVSSKGRGHQVRPLQHIRRLTPDRYRPAGPHDPPTTPYGTDLAAGLDYRMDVEFLPGVRADTVTAALFHAAPGTPLLERRFVFYGETGVPQQISTSMLLMSDVDGTDILDPAREPWPGGTIAQMAMLGLTVTHVDEELGARAPLPEESDTLALSPGVPVITLTRQMYAGERVVEVAREIVMPADRTRLLYRIVVPPPPA